MKHICLALLLFSLFLLPACTDQETLRQTGCPKYIDLNFSNYDSLRTDPIAILSAEVEGDCLKLSLQFGGGCKEHQVDLALILPWCGTPPLPPPTFEIRHDSNNDHCKALITKEYSFDISGIREEGKHQTDFIIAAKNSSGVITNTTYTYSY